MPISCAVRVFFVASLAVAAVAQDALSATVLKTRKQYCVGDDDVTILNLHFRVRVSNRSDKVILIFKSPPKLATWTGVAFSSEDAAAGVFGRSYSPLIVSSDQETVRLFSSRSFVRLSPKGHHDFDVTSWVPVARRGEIAGVTYPIGTYWIAFSMPTWPPTEEDPSKITSRFASLGKLWSEYIGVGPVSFSVDRNPTVRNCKY